VPALFALAVGFGRRAALSLTPWALTALALVAYGTAVVAGGHADLSTLLFLLGLVALAGAITAAYSQFAWASINDRVEVQHPGHLWRARWGAAIVAASFAVAVVALEVASFVHRFSDSAIGS